MRRRRFRFAAPLLALGLLGIAPPFPAAAEPTSAVIGRVAETWLKREWAAYRARFVTADGRVVDNANGGVSHSEGQGYGLLLAAGVGDRDGFATIWRWTADHLRRRSDGLFAWRWDPARGAVTDTNDASDGDLLIAWALARAARRFDRPDLADAAVRIADAVAAAAVGAGHTGPILMPAAAGFAGGDRPDGPVVNLSYWVFPAFRDVAAVSPGRDWAALRASGLRLVEESRFGPLGLPADWESAAGPRPTPARGFPATFGYDAIRIPIYLAWDPEAPAGVLDRFAALAPGAQVSVIDVPTGTPRAAMDGAGYRAVLALARCAARGEAIPPELMTRRDPLYFPETLRLLSLLAAQERFPQCI